MKLLRYLPVCMSLSETEEENIRDIRLRAGEKMALYLPHKVLYGDKTLSAQDVLCAAQALCGHALSSYERQLSCGFIPLEGGHRMGVCGKMTWRPDGKIALEEISSLCVRVCHEVRGAGKNVYPLLSEASALLIGAPGSGKTTLLRDLVRSFALNGETVAVLDERGEIAACVKGEKQMDIGPCDVITGCDKAQGVQMLIRGMAPKRIAMDELGAKEDAIAAMECVRCGVKMLCTAHGRSLGEVLMRPGFADLRKGIFQKLVIVRAPGDYTVEDFDPCD